VGGPGAGKAAAAVAGQMGESLVPALQEAVLEVPA